MKEDPPVKWSELGMVAAVLLIVFLFVAIYWAGKKARGGETMPNQKIVLDVDEDDYRDIMGEIEHYRTVRRRGPSGLLLPDGTSSTEGAIMGEIVRDLRDYRDLLQKERDSRGK